MRARHRSPDAVLIGAVLADAWQPLSLGSGMTAHSAAYTPSARQWLDMVQLCGRIDGTIGTGGVVVATIPAALCPAMALTLPGSIPGGAGVGALIAIATSGVITVGVASGQTTVSLDGLFYRFA